jgi:hypothetical protein
MYEFLSFAQRDNIIAAILLQGNSSYLKDDANYIKSVNGEIDTISYLPKSRIEKVENPWNEGRVNIKIGRFVNKILTEYSIKNFSIDNKIIENFVDIYKSYFSSDPSKLKIVEGSDIMKYYLEDNYYTILNNRVGTLWNSCMRYYKRNSFMKLYSDNIDKVKMLVYLTDDDKIRARALLWYGVKDHENDSKEYNIMDRIYTVYQHDVSLFKSWARDNGFITKWRQDAKSEIYFDENGEKVIKKLYINLDNHIQDYYPYLDTFKFKKNSRFSNDSNYIYDYVLVQANGALFREEEELQFDDDDF